MKNYYKKIFAGAALLLSTIGFSMAEAQTFEPVEYGKSYYISQSQPVYLILDITTPGKLLVQQWGSSDSHLFTTQSPKVIEEALYSDGYISNFEGGYDLPYNLNVGTYYYIAPVGADDIKEAVLTFEPVGNGDNEIFLGTPFEAGTGNDNWVFTATETGILKVSTNYFGNLTAMNSFMYTDYFCTNPLPVRSQESTSTGSDYFFNVTKNQSYYLYYSSILNPVTFTFIMAESAPTVDVKVQTIDPAPGNAFNPRDYADGAQVIFNPRNVTWGEITFSYTPAGSTETVTEVVSGSQILGGALRVNIASLYNEALEKVNDGDYCTITVKDVEYNGSPLNISQVNGATVENGNLTFSYQFAAPPKLISSEVPDPFYAYWAPGNEGAVATFTFNKPIKSAARASVIYAHAVPNSPTPGDTPPISYSVAPMINGNTVTYDFSGTHYDADGKEIKIDSYKGKEVTLSISSFEGENGLFAEFGEFGPNYLKYIPFVAEEAPGHELPEATLIAPVPGVGTMYLMTVTWGYETLEPGNMKAILGLPDGSKEEYKGYIVDEIENGESGSMALAVENNAFQVRFGAGYSQAGVYTLTIPAGTVKVNGVENEEVILKYELGAISYLPYAEDLGAMHTYTNFFSGTEITWDYQNVTANGDLYAEIRFNDGAVKEIRDLTLIYLAPSEEGGEPGVMALDEATNVLNINIFDVALGNIGKKGTYVLTIPEGIVVNEYGEVNPEQSFTYYQTDVDNNATFTPEKGSELVAPEAIVEISWEGYESLAYNPYIGNIFAENNDSRTYLYYNEDVTIEGPALKINMGSLEDGTYNLVIPESYVVMDGIKAMNGEIYATYIITSNAAVAGIESDDNGVYRVYDINGVNVLTTDKAADLGNLTNGLYIINGKKVLVRK